MDQPRERLNIMSNAINDTEFENSVIKSDVPVLVDFWAEWCGPCKQLSPIIDEIAADMEGHVKIVKINIDDNPDTPAKYNVRGIPTLILFKDGAATATKVGALPKGALVDWIESSLKETA